MASILDEVVATVTKKTGLKPDQAKKVVDVVLDILKSKLPAPIAAEMDTLLGGKGGSVEDMASGLMGDLLGGGKKK